FLPFSGNPKIINPASGLVASANSITDPAHYRRSTSAVHVEPRHRQARIESFLASRSDHSVDSFAALQRDIGTDYGVPIRDALLSAMTHTDNAGATDQMIEARELLRAWDGTYATDSVGATICHFTMHTLARRIILAVLGAPTGRRYLNTRRAVYRTQRLLRDAA